MERSAAELRGEVLRAWRLHAGLSSAELARRLPAAPASVTMWETGARASRASSRMPQIRAIAEKLELPADEAVALEDMWFAAGSVTLGFPRTRWAHNFPDPPGLAWAWLRPGLVGEDGAAVLTASGWWSEALQGTLEVSCGAAGMLLQFPTTIPNPPLEVSFAVAGWADFGRGRVPAEVASHCGALLMDARDIIGFSPPRDAPLHPEDEREVSSALDSARRLAADLGLGWRIFAPHIGMIKPRHLTHALDGSSLQPTAWPGNAVIGSDGSIERQALMSAAQLRDVREGRGLSRQQVADQASRLNPLNPITARTIEIMETTGRFPNVAGVVAALDHVYRCDGRLGIDQVFDSVAQQASAGDRFTIRFPGYYVGPIWIHAMGRSANEIGIVDLVWGPWRRRQRIRSGMVVTTRKALADSPPLIIAIPQGWRVVAGIGAAPTAADINHGWYPVSIRAAIRLLRDGITTIRTSQEIPRVDRGMSNNGTAR